MSIGKRLIDFARAELNSLLERAVQDDDDDDGAGRGRGDAWSSLESLSDEELEAELERRRRTREGSERAHREGRTTGTGDAGAGAGRASPTRQRPVNEIARAYAALEVRAGSDFETVRKAYRSMMRKYHPDRHTGSPEKQKAANEVAQKLTEAYKILEKHLRR